MWHCTRVKAAVRREVGCRFVVRLAALRAVRQETYKLSTAVPAAACRGTSVAVIEEIGSPAGA